MHDMFHHTSLSLSVEIEPIKFFTVNLYFKFNTKEVFSLLFSNIVSC